MIAANERTPLSAVSVLGVAIDPNAEIELLIATIHALEQDGQDQSALYLRREHGIWPADHECAFDDTDECVCGSAI